MLKKLLNKIENKRQWKKLYGNLPKIKYKYKKDGLYRDKVEKTKQYLLCVNEVDELAHIEALKIRGEGRGFCHELWACKKQILKDKYNIDWRTPAEMNTDCMFD